MIRDQKRHDQEAANAGERESNGQSHEVAKQFFSGLLTVPLIIPKSAILNEESEVGAEIVIFYFNYWNHKYIGGFAILILFRKFVASGRLPV